MRPEPPRQRASKRGPYTDYIAGRMAEGLKSLGAHRELVALSYDGGYSILKGYASPGRRKRQPEAPMRFETPPVE